MKVNIDEIIDALGDAWDCPVVPKFKPLIERIKQHGIAPPDGYALVPEQVMIDCIEIAMDGCVKARIPECGDFALIAQYLSAEYDAKDKAVLSAVKEKE